MFKLLLTATYLFIAFAPLSAQNIRTYEAEWKKVQNLMQQRNLPKTALEEVKKIYAMAMRDKQDAQIIKSLIYMGRLQQENRIDNIKTSIAETEKEISKHKEPAASILKSLVASLYWQYFQNNRWRLYNRTNTVNFQKEDLATWTIDDFHRKISSLYLESINNRKLLQQTSLDPLMQL
ncbi:MAG TPA: hypothetical protein VM368_05610 [Flavisolibacter sp.]|nr:hypothetical protein [Flavisolibacter sp.]